MTTLVVYESMWGNTRTIAEAIAEGLGPGTSVVEVTRAPAAVPDDVDLLVVGGPTHAFSMSRGSTRDDARRKGAPSGDREHGIREWLEAQASSDRLTVATYDTRVSSVRHLPGSAAKAAGRSVTRHRLGHLLDTESFFVSDLFGPLVDGEVDRARKWGVRLREARAGPEPGSR